MARTRMTLLQRLIIERRLTREQAVKVLHRRAKRIRVDDFALSLRQLDRWLAGEVMTLPRPGTCAVIEAEFGHPVERLLAPADDQRIAPERAATTIDVSSAVSTAAQKSASFGQWADSLGVGDLALVLLWQRLANLANEYVYAPMVPVFSELITLRDEVFGLLVSPDPAQTRNLYLLAGTTCGLLAHASGNLGNVGAARVQVGTALVCARKADHATLAAWVLGVQALQAEWTGRAGESLSLVAKARHAAAAERVPGTVPVWLAAIEARAHARRRDHERARVTLRRLAELRDQVPGNSDKRNEFDTLGGILTFTEAKQHYYTGTTYRRIGDLPAACSYARAALVAYAAGPADQRSYGDESIAWVDLAIAQASGARPDLDGAAEALAPVERQPTERCLPTLLGPLKDLHQALAAPAVRNARLAGQMRSAVAQIALSCRRPAEVGA